MQCELCLETHLFGSCHSSRPTDRLRLPRHSYRTGVYRGRVVTYEIIDGLAVWDGDIILGTPEELEPCGECAAPDQTLDNRNKALAVSSKERLGPGGIIPYVIDPELLNPNVLDAIRHWEQNTPIRFVETMGQPNWVRFVSSDGCRAHLGMVGGEQKVFLSENCGLSTVLHEIGHAVGLRHEQQRNDRDPHYNDSVPFCSSRGVGCMAVPLPWSMKPSRRRCRVAVRSGQGPRLRGIASAQLCPH